MSSYIWSNKKDALLKIPKQLEVCKDYINHQVKIPENNLLKKIIKQWNLLITEESSKVGSGEITEPILNPYIAGNPVTGELFVGREDIMRQLKELWGKAGQCSSVVLYGHRRMGKSSILQNLKYYLDSNTIIVHFDMQLTGDITNTSQLLFLMALEIYYQFNQVKSNCLAIPQENDFITYPRHTFKHFLDKLNQVREEYRFIVTMDEFEIIEEMINEQKLNKELFQFWRGIFQSYQWLIMAFAGLHSLQEMTYDYWQPLYSSVESIGVSFLDSQASAQLIMNPVPIKYTDEVVQEIIKLTNGQAYLIQRICHNLVSQFNQRFQSQKPKNYTFTKEDIDFIVNSQELFSDGLGYFEGIWIQARDSEPNGQLDILRQLCYQPLSSQELNNCLDLTLEQIEDALKTLMRHDVIKQENNQYKYTVELMRRWFKNREADNL